MNSKDFVTMTASMLAASSFSVALGDFPEPGLCAAYFGAMDCELINDDDPSPWTAARGSERSVS